MIDTEHAHERSKMKRINSYISKPQHDKLKQLAKEKGIGVGELLRRVLDEWLEREAEKEKVE